MQGLQGKGRGPTLEWAEGKYGATHQCKLFLREEPEKVAYIM